MKDKSPLDDQWDDLVNDWQSQPYEKLDLNKLIKQLRRRTIGAKILLGFDVLATILLSVACYWHLTQEPYDLPTIIYLGIGAFGSLIYTIICFRIRIQTWRMDASDPQQYYEKTLSGIKGALKFAKLLKYSCYAMVPIINWYLWAVTQASEKPVLILYLFVNLLILVMYIGSHIYQRKREKELKSLLEFIT